MGVKISGVESLLASLSQIGDRAIKGVSDELKKGADEIRDLAKDYAPIDEGNLVNAIKSEHDRTGINGRLQAYVYVDGSEPADNGRTVDDYAMRMHEGEYNLGELSRRKDAGRGVVGLKYLERAVNKKRNVIYRNIEKRIKGLLR